MGQDYSDVADVGIVRKVGELLRYMHSQKMWKRCCK